MKFLIVLGLVIGIIYFIVYMVKKKINNFLGNMFGQMQNPNNFEGKQNFTSNQSEENTIGKKSDEVIYKHGETVILKGDAKKSDKT